MCQLASEMHEKEFWDGVKDYNQKIISVFIQNNLLIEKLAAITDKHSKEVADFGCGIGNALPVLKDFKTIYAIDYSAEMLAKAEQNHADLTQAIFIEDDLKILKFQHPVDVALAISSIFPQNYDEFDLILNNLLRNLKPNGELFITLPSFESATLLFQLIFHHQRNQGKTETSLQRLIDKSTNQSQYNPLGYLKNDAHFVQKYWLKEELEFRLSFYDLKNVAISKLELDWTAQMKMANYQSYPSLWLWFIHLRTV